MILRAGNAAVAAEDDVVLDGGAHGHSIIGHQLLVGRLCHVFSGDNSTQSRSDCVAFPSTVDYDKQRELSPSASDVLAFPPFQSSLDAYVRLCNSATLLSCMSALAYPLVLPLLCSKRQGPFFFFF